MDIEFLVEIWYNSPEVITLPKGIKGFQPGHETSQETREKISAALSDDFYAVCDCCGKRFKMRRSHYPRTKHHFCSRQCYSDYRKNSLPFYEQNSYKGVRQADESKQVYHRNYCKSHPENIAHYKARRYAVEKGAPGKHTKAEWDALKERYNYCCAICGEKKPLTVDHIIPLSKGGSDDISNIQPLCRNCNSKKNNKLDYSPAS